MKKMNRKYVLKKKGLLFLAKTIDAIGDLCTAPFRRTSPVRIAEIKKVLAVRIDHLGDALLLRPALKEWANKYPDLAIDVLTTVENAPVFQFDSFVNNVWTFDNHWFQPLASRFSQIRSFIKLIQFLRKQKYDAAIDFRGDARINLILLLSNISTRIGYGVTGGGWILSHERLKENGIHEVCQNLKILEDWLPCQETPIPNVPVGWPKSIQSHCESKITQWSSSYAILHAGAGNPIKQRPKDFYHHLALQLLEQNIIQKIVWIGTASEKIRMPLPSEPHFVDLRGLTDLHELAFLLSRAKFFLGNDSGPAHLAAAQGIPVMVIANKTNDMTIWRPWTGKLRIIGASLDHDQAIAASIEAVHQLLAIVK